jgi:RNA polymerase I-specific transcription initiation factor RRN3
MEQNSVGLDLSKHAIFYSAVQSVLYVFCFRWKELTCVEPSTQAMPGTPYKRRRLNSLTCANGIAFAAGSDFDDQVVEESDYGDDASTATGLASPHMEWWKTRGGFQRVIFSRLNPLQACSRTVVTEFDKISQQLEMIYCSSLIEMNAYNSRQTQVKALPLQVDSATGQNFVEEVIEAFFPFDPYYNHLSSREQIDSLYVRWHTEVSRFQLLTESLFIHRTFLVMAKTTKNPKSKLYKSCYPFHLPFDIAVHFEQSTWNSFFAIA